MIVTRGLGAGPYPGPVATFGLGVSLSGEPIIRRGSASAEPSRYIRRPRKDRPSLVFITPSGEVSATPSSVHGDAVLSAFTPALPVQQKSPVRDDIAIPFGLLDFVPTRTWVADGLYEYLKVYGPINDDAEALIFILSQV